MNVLFIFLEINLECVAECWNFVLEQKYTNKKMNKKQNANLTSQFVAEKKMKH